MTQYGNNVKAIKKDIKEEKGNTAIYRSLQCNEVTAWLSSLQEDYTKLSR